MKISILTATLLIFFSSALAQSGGKILGTVLQNAKPAEGATISLLRAKDSVTVKFYIVSKQGSYVFENIANGNYLVAVTAIGYKKTFCSRLWLFTEAA